MRMFQQVSKRFVNNHELGEESKKIDNFWKIKSYYKTSKKNLKKT